MITVVVSFTPATGKRDALVAWLSQKQAEVSQQPGFLSITLVEDERGVVEVETWTTRAAHEAMVAALEWTALDALVAAEPDVRYLAPADPMEIVTTRVLPFPRDRVFAAWTTASTIARWWGPRGFTNVFEEFDPRAGGRWKFVMRGPDGRDYKNESTFREVAAPARIVFDHLSGPVYHAIITFTDAGASTIISWRMRFDNPKFLAANRALVVNGNTDNLDKLTELLSAQLDS